MRFWLCILACLLALTGLGCASVAEVAPPVKAEIAVSETAMMQISSEEASTELVQSLLGSAWLSAFRSEKGRTPVILIGAVDGDSIAGFVNGEFRELLQKKLLQEAKVYLVVSSYPSAIPQSLSAAKQLSEQSGADFLLVASLINRDGLAFIEVTLIALAELEPVWNQSLVLNKLKT